MNANSLFIAIAASVIFCATPAWAQHDHHRRHAPWHHNHVIIDPHGQEIDRNLGNGVGRWHVLRADRSSASNNPEFCV